MRSRTVREGSVGLFIVVGLAVFGGLILWVRNFSIGRNTYKTVVQFENVSGLQVGGAVRYRGVQVGKITDIKPSTGGVDVAVEITSADVVIPREGLAIETSQSGFIGETYIDIKLTKPLPPGFKAAKPTDSSCNSTLIVCDKSRLQGQVGVSFEEALRSGVRLANLYSDPKLFANINRVTENTATAAAGVTQLTRDLSGLTRSVQQEVKTFSGAANSVTKAANQTAYQAGLAANQIGRTADRFGVVANQVSSTVNQFGSTANQFSLAANQIGRTANQYGTSAQQLNQLLGSVNNLVVANRGNLVTTLSNFSQASNELRVAAGSLKPTLNEVNSTFSSVNSTVKRFNSVQLVRNLETLSANAAIASADAAKATANLRDLSTGLNSLNTRENLVQLQRTLDSAQAVFENAQKITSDLDELTGDPAFRTNVRNLVNGLGKLVSSTQQLEQQVQVAHVLAPYAMKINMPISDRAAIDRPPFSQNFPEQAQIPMNAVSASYANQPVLDKSSKTGGDRAQKPLRSLFEPSESPSKDELLVPDDQPESKD